MILHSDVMSKGKGGCQGDASQERAGVSVLKEGQRGLVKDCMEALVVWIRQTGVGSQLTTWQTYSKR